MLVIKPDSKYFKVFLAGSIEQGKAEEWQDKIVKPFECTNIMFFNPRNDNWLYKDKDSESKQIRWELDHLEKADLIAMYLDPNTKSCISLLELGLYVNSGKLIVACPNSFWRYQNVYETCTRYKVELLNNLDELSLRISNIYNNVE